MIRHLAILVFCASMLSWTDAFAQAHAPELASPILIQADGAPIDVSSDRGHSGPLYRDFTGDGVPDLLVSSFSGSIRLFENRGTLAAPNFTASGLLVAGGEPIRVHNW